MPAPNPSRSSGSTVLQVRIILYYYHIEYFNLNRIKTRYSLTRRAQSPRDILCAIALQVSRYVHHCIDAPY